jgi:capsular polysaccharide transport system permease protein
MESARSHLAVTLSVWKALFLRESLSRLFAARAAWFWLVLEPAFHAAYLVFIFTVVRVRPVGGIDTTVWILVGLLAFFMFRRTGTQVMNALSANKALFAYRQVKPVDTTLVRGGLEGFLMAAIAAIQLGGAALLGHDVLPDDPLQVIEVFATLWLLGVGFGLAASVATELVPEAGRVIKLVMMPMYLLSGVMFPLSIVPPPYRDWLLLNPVAHGLELARAGFAGHYHMVPGVSEPFLQGCALAMLFLGLALHRRFASRLASQ